MPLAVGTAGTACRQEPPVTRGWRAGTAQLRLPRGVVRLVTLIAATAPGPSLVTFARLPLAGPGERGLESDCGGSKEYIALLRNIV